MNVMTHTLERKPVETASIDDIAEMTAGACLATRVRQLSRIVTRVYDDAMRPLGITASQYTLLAQLAARDSITAVEIGHELDIEKSTLSRNLKRLLALRHINMDPPAGRRGRGLHTDDMLELEPMLTDSQLKQFLAQLAGIDLLKRAESGEWLLARDLDTLTLADLYEACQLRVPVSEAWLPCRDDALGAAAIAALDELRLPLRGLLKRNVAHIHPPTGETA